jgi:hypothetical protein
VDEQVGGLAHRIGLRGLVPPFLCGRLGWGLLDAPEGRRAAELLLAARSPPLLLALRSCRPRPLCHNTQPVSAGRGGQGRGPGQRDTKTHTNHTMNKPPAGQGPSSSRIA